MLTVGLIGLVYRSEFRTRRRLRSESRPWHADWPIIIKSVAVSLAMIAAFFAGVPPAEAAIVGGAFLLLTRRIKSEKVYAEIDWTLLLMFAGLFIVVAGLEHSVLSPEVIGAVARLRLERIPVLSGITAILSNIVSNVPAVLVLKPFIAQLRPQQQAWLTVAMASTLAGNFTLVGSVANLIVVQRARAQNVEIGAGRAIDGIDDRHRRAVARIRAKTLLAWRYPVASETSLETGSGLLESPVRARHAPRLRSRSARPSCHRPRLFRNRPR